ncbi:ABC transporter permease [Dawidia soli]|uniref:ABC transporter permease n=1 Tax=Dawidia soli TaxID=2782352 RepID=A0AAP2D806_9BACT|nr:ABC transporter permease [Dawidia soli]MBT1687181.1 ABC transporter permease [Dawidia soli]
MPIIDQVVRPFYTKTTVFQAWHYFSKTNSETQPPTAMLLNYLRIAYRNLLKNRIFTIINITGLALGMAAFLFIVQYIRFERSYEDFHKNGDNILRVTVDFYNGDQYDMTDCESYAPLGPLLKDKMPEVTDFVRMYGMDGLVNVRAGTRNFLETKIYWADPSVLTVFTYQVLHGDAATALTAPFEVIVTESMAKKYFGRTNVIDELIDVDNNPYRVKAVIADPPPNTHIKFTFLLSRLSFKTLKPWYPDDKWNNNNEYTYILTTPGTDLEQLNKKLHALTATELKGILEQEYFVAERIKDIHLHSNKAYEPEPPGDIKAVYYLSFIAIFLIVIAWVNYLNLSTARAMERAREVGVRKVMGSLKMQLVFQFLCESILVNVLAGVLALTMLQLAFPLLQDLSGQPVPLNILHDRFFWSLFTSLLAAGSFLSGIYPAFVLASFKPVAVLKGKFQSSTHGQLLRKGLVIFQFSATVILIISMCTVYLQVRFLQRYDLGMNIDQTLVLTGRQVSLPDSVARRASQALKTELMKNPAVRSVTRAGSLPGVNIQELSTTHVLRLGQSSANGGGYLYSYIPIDADFIPSLNITLLAGRNFENGVPNHDQVIINEEAARALGFASPEQAVGTKVTFRTRSGAEGSTVIGVLRNFYFRSPKEQHLPMLFAYGENADYFALQLTTGDIKKTLAFVEDTWHRVYPNMVFDYFFLNERYDNQYRADTHLFQIMVAFSALIIFIACLGLFGLSSYTILQRRKEIGIRKVLGASVGTVVSLLSRDFMKTVTVSALMAVPVAYFLMQAWLSAYAVRITLHAGIFIFAIASVILLALITVSVQTIKSAMANPTESLKQE